MVYSFSNLRRLTIHLEEKKNPIFFTKTEEALIGFSWNRMTYEACAAISCAMLHETQLSALRFQRHVHFAF